MSPYWSIRRTSGSLSSFLFLQINLSCDSTCESTLAQYRHWDCRFVSSGWYRSDVRVIFRVLLFPSRISLLLSVNFASNSRGIFQARSRHSYVLTFEKWGACVPISLSSVSRPIRVCRMLWSRFLRNDVCAGVVVGYILKFIEKRCPNYSTNVEIPQIDR